MTMLKCYKLLDSVAPYSMEKFCMKKLYIWGFNESDGITLFPICSFIVPPILFFFFLNFISSLFIIIIIILFYLGGCSYTSPLPVEAGFLCITIELLEGKHASFLLYVNRYLRRVGQHFGLLFQLL